MVSTNVKVGMFMGCGSFLVVTGAIMVAFWPIMFFNQLRNMMVLTPKSESFDIWQETPIPMYLECFFLNISNVDEILKGHNVKPHIVQMGPYVFRETHSKTNLTWYDNSTIAFYNNRTWYWVPEKSNGSLSDMVTSINPMIATIAYMLRFHGQLVAILANSAMRAIHEHPFITANASTWMFEGIQDPVLDIASKLPDVNIAIPYKRFGWFFERNGSETFDGRFLMNTGAQDFSQLGNVEKWKYSNRTPYRDECGEVRGSTGELWAPEIGQEEVTLFASDICTYMILSKDSAHVVENIEGQRYAANKSLFDNGHHYKHAACYCDKEHPEECMPSGAINISLCRYGAPAFVSLPHFYNADPVYVQEVTGLDPTPEHNFRLTLEMITGMPLAVAAQLQINMLVRKVPGFSILDFFEKDIMIPMFWFRQELEMTPEYARLARFALNLRSGMMIGFIVATVIGIVLLLVGIVVLIKKLMRSPETMPILEETDRND